jgi:prevent-host-death family protein
MVKVAVTEFQAHMDQYLANVMKGQIIVLTSDGQPVAELKQPSDHRKLARAKLKEMAAMAKVGDVVSPVIDDFEAM